MTLAGLVKVTSLTVSNKKSLTRAGLFAFDRSQEREVKAASGCVC